MINLLVTVFGGLLLIGGFYGMSFGFSTPPNFGLFFIGLCSSVFGIILMVFFSSKIDFSRSESVSKNKVPKKAPKPVGTKKGALENIGKTIKPPKAAKPSKPSQKIQPVKSKPAKAEEKAPSKPVEKPKEISKPSKPEKLEQPKQITPVTSRPVPKKVNNKPSSNSSTAAKEPEVSKPPEITKEEPKIAPISKPTESKDKEPAKPVLLKESGAKAKDKPVPKHIDVSKLKSAKEKDEQEFVKNRLDRLKENYIKNAKDIESIIDERLDSFKGTLDTLKSESQEPSIIWSFDAGDVQDALKDTISKANEKILMMYPWIRNIDVSILKKFMDTESRMIIQEASLDDDTSVELIKLLMDKNVKIRTMPHVHTVAVVSDNSNGLIISTDPIYESFEVGVMYKDQKSIEEIERLFEDAWEISKDVDMELE